MKNLRNLVTQTKEGISTMANLDWFFHLTGGHTHTDFFAVRPTDYSKANEGEDFEDIW
jgi:ribonucleotide reductase beta subunit family protein with ferritin-like domain